MTNSRRDALRLLTFGAAGAFFAPTITACAEENGTPRTPVVPAAPAQNGTYTLPELPYSYDALEPHIDARTMEIHHSRHHQAYVNNLNNALAEYPQLQDQSLEELLQNLNLVPDDIRETVRNNGGGHWNHAFFWPIMSPAGGGMPGGELGQAIADSFGSFDAFQSEFKDAATGVFGSGWAWLVANGGGLEIVKTPNQDTPVMDGRHPIIGIDVWEHAYYLQYQNRRADYVDHFWNVVDWQKAEEHFRAA